MIIALVTMLEKCTDIVGMVRMEDTEREMQIPSVSNVIEVLN